MKTRPKKTRLCQLPSPGSISGRSSSITNAFFNAIVPTHPPTEEEELEALRILGMDAKDVRCAYCGDKSTEWDHLRPIITNQKPTGYITEIANLVPACGKCNQSKGKRDWAEWMQSSARLSPKSRGVADLEARLEKLTLYAVWKPPTKIEFDRIISPEMWQKHESNWTEVLGLLRESEKLAKDIRSMIEQAPKHHNVATGQITYGGLRTQSGQIAGEDELSAAIREGKEVAERKGWLTHEEVVERINKRLKPPHSPNILPPATPP